MTDPSKERIAAALRLANAVDKQIGVPGDLCPLAQEALKAYRATLPRIRSRAEVDGEIATVCRMAYGAATIDTAFYRERVEKLCAEPTDSGPSSVDAPKPKLTLHVHASGNTMPVKHNPREEVHRIVSCTDQADALRGLPDIGAIHVHEGCYNPRMADYLIAHVLQPYGVPIQLGNEGGRCLMPLPRGT